MKQTGILLVEDNPNDELLTLRVLQKHHLGNPVTVVRDGVAALDHLHGPEAAVRELPALVMLDLQLPKVSGLEVLRRIRAEERTRLLPVVVLTSSDEERDIQESYRSGANSYVRKPVDFAEFSEAVRQLGFYWLIINQVPAGE